MKCVEPGAESLRIARELANKWLLQREARVGCGGPDRRQNLHLSLNERLLFRGTELTLPEIKRMDRCSATLELRGQDTGCQMQKQGESKTKTPPNLCSEAVTALAQIYSI